MRSAPSIGGICLAGGLGRRIGGRFKAFLPLQEERIFDRLYRLLSSLFDEIVVVTDRSEAFAPFEVKAVSDRLRGIGPLGGIDAGLRSLKSDKGFVVASDMPGLSADAIRWMMAQSGPEEVLAPVFQGRPQPLHAIYAVGCAPQIEPFAARGGRALHRFLSEVRTTYLPPEAFPAEIDLSRAFFNVNTPEDLEGWQRR
ncbi:MAG: molybdenum cofactor guanylyltransferase [Nitrospirae bacterium]|nr:molybdenum cofactor guanylyltransferase [Candidatus Manganitrophaceae bacterium]